MPGDFAAARTRCHSEDATAYAACMRELGFFVSTPASGGLLGARDEFEAEYAADPAEDDDYAENVADEGAPPFGSTDAPATGGVPAASAAPRAGPGAATPGAGAQAVPPRHKRAPRTPVAIGSWWKLGGSTGELERVRAECEAREPPGTVLSNGDASVTWTLRKCMRAQGWIGIVRQ